MCELFGVSAKRPIIVNDYLREFVSHSCNHPNGWGIAVFYDGAVSLEKEPVTASKSAYLKERLKHKVEAKNMVAHIRLATIGAEKYENCHPFIRRDNSGRAWTLIHNGTIFDSRTLDQYFVKQEGKTDSERILYYLIDEIDRKAAELNRELTDSERFDVVSSVIREITPNNNKVNLIIYDSTQFYVHTNMRGTLYRKQSDEGTVFSTLPLDKVNWEPLPLTQLLAYEDGELKYSATPHNNEYIYDAAQMKYIYLESASL